MSRLFLCPYVRSSASRSCAEKRGPEAPAPPASLGPFVLGVGLAVSVVSSLCACADPSEPTSVLVEVTSDLAVGSELTELRVQIFDRAGGNELALRSIALSTTSGRPAQYTLPASFAITPSARDVTDFRVVVTGRGPLGGVSVMDLVEQQVIGTFVQHEQRVLALALARSCLGQLCRDAMDLRNELTCSSGACVSAQESSDELP